MIMILKRPTRTRKTILRYLIKLSSRAVRTRKTSQRKREDVAEEKRNLPMAAKIIIIPAVILIASHLAATVLPVMTIKKTKQIIGTRHLVLGTNFL